MDFLARLNKEISNLNFEADAYRLFEGKVSVRWGSNSFLYFELKKDYENDDVFAETLMEIVSRISITVFYEQYIIDEIKKQEKFADLRIRFASKNDTLDLIIIKDGFRTTSSFSYEQINFEKILYCVETFLLSFEEQASPNQVS